MNEDLLLQNDFQATHRLILLHGWGADAEDLMPFGKVLIQDLKQKFEIISLRAPHLNADADGRFWYDLFPADWSAVPHEINSLKARLKLLSESIPIQKTVLLGFSQGGAMALSAGCELPFAGLICCSSYPHPGWIPPSEIPPILISHGRFDDLINYNLAEELYESVKKIQLNTELILFNGGHTIPSELIPQLSLRINSWLS